MGLPVLSGLGEDPVTSINLIATHIPLDPFDRPSGNPMQRATGSRDDRIRSGQTYFAKIFGRWFFGTFTEQWYGWSFNEWGTSGIQLNSIEDLYECNPPT